MPLARDMSPVFRKYLQPVGTGTVLTYAHALVAVKYTGLDAEGNDRHYSVRRKLPVKLGYMNKARVRDLTIQDVDDALRREHGESRQIIEVLGFYQTQPRAERLKTGTFRRPGEKPRGKGNARKSDRRTRARSV